MAEEYTNMPYTYDIPAYGSELLELYKIHTEPASNHSCVAFSRDFEDPGKLQNYLNLFFSLYNDKKPCLGTIQYHTDLNYFADDSFVKKYNAIIHVAKLMFSKPGLTLLIKACRDNGSIVLPDIKYFYEEYNYCSRAKDIAESERLKLFNDFAAATFSCFFDSRNNLTSLHSQLDEKDRLVIKKEMEKTRGDGKK